MQVDITLKNYRCFPDTNPVRISLRKGFIALVGVNNSGKSSLLKFFYEFRRLFGRISALDDNFITALQSGRPGYELAPTVLDRQEVYCNSNDRDLEIRLQITDANVLQNDLPVPDQLILTMERNGGSYLARLHVGDELLVLSERPIARTQGKLNQDGIYIADLNPIIQASKALASTLYIGAFRNAINIGAKQDYFDIQVGQAFVKAWRNYKTGNVKKNNEAAYRLTEDIKRIFGFGELEINPSAAIPATAIHLT